MSAEFSSADAFMANGAADSATISALRQAVLFRGLPERVLVQLSACSRVFEAEEGIVLYEQGALAAELLVLLGGQLAAFSVSANGATAVVEVIREGETLGLSTVLARVPRLVGVRTVSRCRLLSVDAEGLVTLVEREPSLVTTLMRAEAQEFRGLVRQVCDLKLRTTAQRLGCYLLSLATDERANTSAMRLPFDKRLLAARLGCRQENLSRAFAALRSCGVETHGARVILHDIAKLRAYSEPDDSFESATI